jgi:oxygen-dependent protoporphyrinogen oxidase
MDPLALLRTPLLSARGKGRLLAEPFVRRGDARGASVAEFAARRLGPEAVSALIGPFRTGVYAGDETRLGAEAVFPGLVAAERRSGSIVRGLLAASFDRGRSRGRAGSWSTASGLQGWIDALSAPLGARLRLAARVSEIRFEEDIYHVEIEGESPLRARAIVAALPAPAAAAVLGVLEPAAAAQLATIAYAPVASVSFGVDPTTVREPIRGFGFLVPRGDGDALLGCLFLSQLFPARAPAGRQLVTLLAGGMRRPDLLDEADDRVRATLLRELDAALGLRDEPTLLGVTRWPCAVPQPGRDHGRVVARARGQLAKFPRFALAGAAFDGVAFGDALASGAAAAARLGV